MKRDDLLAVCTAICYDNSDESVYDVQYAAHAALARSMAIFHAIENAKEIVKEQQEDKT